jgi:hydroxylamine reductase
MCSRCRRPCSTASRAWPPTPHHARRLGKHDEEVSAFIEEALFATMTNVNFDIRRCWLLPEVRRDEPAGDADARRGPHRAFGKPAPTQVTEGTKAGPGHPGHRPRPAGPVAICCSRSRAPTSRSTPTARCCPAHMYPLPGSIRTWPVTTAAPGRSRRRNSPPFPARWWHHQLRADPAGELQGPAVHHQCGGRARRHSISHRRLLPGHRRGQACEPCVEQITGDSTVGFHRTVLLEQARDHRRRRQGRQDQPLLRHRRLRRRREGPQLLHRLCQAHARRIRSS